VSAVRGREGPGFISPTDQGERNRGYAKAYGHTIIEEGRDLDKSGGDMSRPTFDRFLEMIRNGEADGIIVAKLDRFARSNKGALEAIEELESHGGVLISVAEQIDPTTASGRFMRNVLLATAQWERDRIGEQWLTSRTRAVDRGIHVSHHVPPGYVRGSKTGDPSTDRRLTPHRKHANTIKHAFEMAAEGMTDHEIADYLNARQLAVISIKSGEKPTYWQSFRVQRLLANRVYLGEAHSGKGIANLNAHPALVDEETWELAQRQATSHPALRRPNRSAKQPPSVLSGIARCAGCSFAMKPQAAGKTSPAIYRCVTTSVHGRCPSPATITKARLEKHVLAEFVARADAYLVGEPSQADTADMRRAVAEAKAAEQRYRNALTNVSLRTKIGDVDHDTLVASLHDDWQARRRVVETANGDRVAVAPPAGMTISELVEQLQREGKNAELRSNLEAGVEAVFVRPARSKARNLPVEDRVQIVWRSTEPTLELPRRGRRFEPRPFAW
jgi:DNA invertase Pin-like site-specific DNA recombinase